MKLPVAAVVLLLGLQSGKDSLDTVMHRASSYVGTYLKELGSVIGEEQYSQDSVWNDPVMPYRNGRRKTNQRGRYMISDFMTVPVGDEWIGFRHVRKVDDVTLDPLYRGVYREAYDETTSDGRRQLQEAFTFESTRYNIGDVSRSTNLPTFPLELLDEGNLAAFNFSKSGEEKIGAVQTWKIKFSERTRNLLRMTTSIGPEERYGLSGMFWIEPATGKVFRAEVNFKHQIIEDRDMQMDVRFRPDPTIGLLVPDIMNEHIGDRRSFNEIESHANYMNFRRFGSDVKLEDVLLAEGATDDGGLRSDGEDRYAVKVNVKVVNVETWVTAGGSSVTDLKANDFEISENGIPQTVTNFSTVSTPYDVLLLFDQSGSTRRDWLTMQRAAERFIQGTRVQDRVGLAIFNSSFRMLTRWSSSRDEIVRSVAKLTEAQGTQGTAFYRGVEMSLASELLPVAGRRRALIILTDGRDNGLMRMVQRQGRVPAPAEEAPYQQMLDLSRRLRVPIYVISYASADNEVVQITMAYSPLMADQYVEGVARRLELLSEVTGGRTVFPKTVQDVIPMYSQISHDLTSAYSIGYVSNLADTFRGFREIKVTTRDPRLHVIQSRPGYVAQ